MNYSRIYQFTPSAGGDDVALACALPGSNADDAHGDLFDSLRAAFHSNARRQHGIFDVEAATPALATAIGDYHAQTLEAEAMGIRLAEQLKQGMNGVDLRHPWYLWFVIEQNGADEFIYLFLLKQEESHRISGEHTVVSGAAIRPDRLQYAVKVSIGEWQARSQTCVTHLAPRSQSPVTLAWKALVGFAENVEQAAQTEVLLAAVDQYAEELPAEEAHEYRARVAEYCLDRDRVGERVEMEALSRHVNEDAPSALLDFLAGNIEEPAPALYADRKQLKRYTRLFGRDNDLSIGFSTAALGRHIIYDERTETLTISAIPAALKSQLARYAKKSG